MYSSGISESPTSAVRGVTSDTGTSAKNISKAIKADADERIEAVKSGPAPQGVDADLWSILTKEEKTIFAKTGGQGLLTYTSTYAGTGVSAMPIVRGIRLDIRI